LKRLLRGKSGASILFVLVAMALLMVIGFSTLTAASANIGARHNRQIHNRIDMYAESLQRTVKHSLVETSGDDDGKLLDDADTLGGQILRAAYEGARPDGVAGGTLTITLKPPDIAAGTDIDLLGVIVLRIEIDINPLDVVITKPWIQQTTIPDPDDEDEIKIIETRIPGSASISGVATIIVTVEGEGHRRRAVTTAATYNLSGGYLEENRDEIEFDATLDTLDMGDMKIVNAGDWGFISYEKVDR